MNTPRLLFVAVLAGSLLATSARATAPWTLRVAAGESISNGHGSTVEAALLLEPKRDLRVGMETGLARMTTQSVGTGRPVIEVAQDAGRAVASLTDGLTRDRVFFLGPQVRWGSSMYAVASYGMADVRGSSGPDLYLQGGSLGVGVGSTGRWQPSAELRWRFVRDVPPSQSPALAGDAITFTVGVHVR